MVTPEWITAIATTLTAIFAFYEFVWAKRPDIKIEALTKEVLSGMNSISKKDEGYKGWICVIVRNKSTVPLKGTGKVITDKEEYSLYDSYKYQLTSPEPRASAEPFKFFEIAPMEVKNLFGHVDSITDSVTIKIQIGKTVWREQFSLKEIV